MGAKTWMLVYSNGDAAGTLRRKPRLDRAKSVAVAKQLFGSSRLEEVEDVDLSDTSPRGRDIHVGCYDDVRVVAAKEIGIDRPSQLKPLFLNPQLGSTVCLHAMHSVVDWFAYAIWRDGALVRSLSLSPDSGIMEDIGTAQEFEEPYWSGANPVLDDDDEADAYPFVFHPLELGEAALLAMFGYQLEAYVDASQVQPEEFSLLRFKRPRKWKFW